MNVIPGDDILHARSHGGTDGEDKALFEGPAQQAQHAVPLRAVREVGHTVCSWVPNTWVGVLWLFAAKELKQDRFKVALMASKQFCLLGSLLQLVFKNRDHLYCCEKDPSLCQICFFTQDLTMPA